MDQFKIRIRFIALLMTLCFIVVIGRLFQIQVVQGQKYAAKCKQQSKSRALLAASRGSIRDCKGSVMAKSIAGGLNMEQAVIIKKPDKEKENAGKAGSPNATSRRVYPYGELAGAVLGYVGTESKGLAGVEFAFDDYLCGENGWSIVQRDARNVRFARIDMPQKLPENGCDVYLTLDMQIQKIVASVLKETVTKSCAKGGMAMVMDPLTGDILAMADEPDFNPNIWRNFPAERRKNRCISYNYEPGSTYKLITAASALQDNLFNENDTLDGNQGTYEIYGEVICDHKPFGKLSFDQALCYSSNVCFAKIANGIGNKRFDTFTRDFGFGCPTGIKLPGEEAGIVHPLEEWSGRTRVTMAIGQELSTTFLQMMIAYCAVANGGIILEPNIYHKIINSRGEVVAVREVKPKRRVISENIALRLRRILEGVITYGTARGCGLPGLSVGGKTGTSQKIDSATGAYSRQQVCASFIGFTPVESPVLLCGVMIDDPAGSAYGGTVAGPAFKQILLQIINHPDLKYAQELLGGQPVDTVRNHDAKPGIHGAPKNLPYLCGMDRNKAAGFLSHEKIAFEIIGTGQRIVYQSPDAGKVLTTDTKLILYTTQRYTQDGNRDDAKLQVCVPNCTGKDLRDAINILTIKGLVPYVRGAGIVIKQVPESGALMKSMSRCTLFCSFDG